MTNSNRYPIMQYPLQANFFLLLVFLVFFLNDHTTFAGPIDPVRVKELSPKGSSTFSSPPVHSVSRYSRRSSSSRIQEVCEGVLSPDQVVIPAGITVESLKPIQGRDELQRKMDAIEGLVESKGGTIVELEKVRSIRQLPKHQKHQQDQKLPYVLLQRLEFVFPPNVDIDEVLEGLSRLGVDRLGKTIRPGRTNSNPQVVVFYRFSNLMEELNGIHRKCRVRAVKKWCRNLQDESPFPGCQKVEENLETRFPTTSLHLISQPVIAKNYHSRPISFSYPWRPKTLNTIELLGNVTLKLSGKLVLDPIKD